MPVPQGVSLVAGLLTVDLPATVRKGQVFKIVVRQVTTGPVSAPPSISQALLREAIRVREERAAAAATGAFIEAATTTFQSVTAVAATPPRKARRVLGAFQITVPVHTADMILPDEQRGLAITRGILGTIPEENRWFLPFRRYVAQIADRVDALGGDSRADGGSGGTFGFGDDGESPADGGDRDHDRDRDKRRGGCIAMIFRLIMRLFGRR